jgi:hypothetical protein
LLTQGIDIGAAAVPRNQNARRSPSAFAGSDLVVLMKEILMPWRNVGRVNPSRQFARLL